MRRKTCVRLVTGEEPTLGLTAQEREELAQRSADSLSPERRYFRGLYTGGTFSERR